MPAVPQHTVQSSGDTSSNTDASSISRQSIFEPPTETRQDTPRTSQELSLSDDEQQRSAQGPTTADLTKVRKPALPQSHHGRPMLENRTPTDLNKPLPPPPVVEGTGPDAFNSLYSCSSPKLDPQAESPSRKECLLHRHPLDDRA